MIAAALLAAALPGRAGPRLASATVAMRVELNRPYIDVTLEGPVGRPVRARAWVDTGGGGLLLSAGLARRLGLAPDGKAIRTEGSLIAGTSAPRLAIGGMPIALAGRRSTYIAEDAPEMLQDTDAQLALPGRLLRRYVVALDYPARTFTIARPRAALLEGTRVDSYIGASGMPVVWLSVGGVRRGFLLDSGGQYLMVSAAALHAWTTAHPDWPAVAGAFGPADMLLGTAEAKFDMVRLASLVWGPYRIAHAGAVSRRPGVYERGMSAMLGRPVIGSIGGNVLRAFRVTIDYPHGVVYLKKIRTLTPPLSMVAVTLEPAARGGYRVAGVAPGVPGVEAGDRLLTVDGLEVSGLPFFRLVAMLSGRPGQMRTLTLRRAGRTVRARVPVRSIF